MTQVFPLLLTPEQVYPYVIEAVFVVVYAVLMGVSIATPEGEASVQKYYNFIIHSVLAGVTLVGHGSFSCRPACHRVICSVSVVKKCHC